MSFVLDASAALAWLFEDEADPTAEVALDHLQRTGAVVPSLWLYEVANGLVVAERKRRITTAQGRHFLELLARLPIDVREADPGSVWFDAPALAREHGLSAYDASYLELAMREGVQLATLDAALGEAAERAGVALLRPGEVGGGP